VYRNQKNQVRHLSKQEYVALKTLCRLSKNLYNATLYAIRQYYFTEKKHLRYESAYQTSFEIPHLYRWRVVDNSCYFSPSNYTRYWDLGNQIYSYQEAQQGISLESVVYYIIYINII